MTYQEQEELLQEIKKRPDIKQMRKKARVFQILGEVFFIIGLGIGFLIAGEILTKKSKNRIDEELAIAVEKKEKEERALKERENKTLEEGQRIGAETLFVAETDSTAATQTCYAPMENVQRAMAAEKALQNEKEETRNRVERLVKVSKTYYKLNFFIFLTLMVSFLFLTFVPICSVIGLVGVNMFDVIKDFFKVFLEDVSGWKVYVEFAAVGIYCFMGIFTLIAMLNMAIKLLTTSSLEMIIRETKGKLEVPLTAQELRNIKGKALGSSQFNGPIMGWMYMLFLPVWFFVENREILLMDYMMLFYLISFFMASWALAIVACIFVHKNQKEVELFLGIKISYKRFKIHKFKQELE